MREYLQWPLLYNNVLYLDRCPVKAARAVADIDIKRGIAMAGEALTSAWRYVEREKYTKRVGDSTQTAPWNTLPIIVAELHGVRTYPATLVTHDVLQWVLCSGGNYVWLYRHAFALWVEYAERSGDTRMPSLPLRVLEILPDILRDSRMVFTEPPPMLPEYIRDGRCVVDAYREFYRLRWVGELPYEIRYTNRDTPRWLPQSSPRLGRHRF